MNSGKVVLGAIAGIAAGAVLGILFAPDKGTNTRKKLKEKGKDAAGNLKTRYNDAIDSLTSKLDEVKKESLNFYEEEIDLAQNTKNHLAKSLK